MNKVSQKRNMPSMYKVILAICIFLGIVFTICGFVDLSKSFYYMNNGEKTSAEVLEVYYTGAAETLSQYARVKYVVKGKTYEAHVSVDNRKTPYVGGKIMIWYLRDDPNKCILVQEFFVYYIAFPLGIVCFGGVVFAYIKGRKKGKLEYEKSESKRKEDREQMQELAEGE